MKKIIIVGVATSVVLGFFLGVMTSEKKIDITPGIWEVNQEYIVETITNGILNYKNSDEIKYARIRPLIEEHKNGMLRLVNKKNSVEASFIPKRIIKPSVKTTGGGITISSEINEPLNNMFNDAMSQGLDLYLLSGYRSYGTQKSIYRSKPEWKRGLYSAKEGQSEHQLGLAVDITSRESNLKLYTSFGNTKSGIWLRDNAYKYGFILRYPKGREADTGYAYEPWHFRYVGQDMAKFIYENNLILEDVYNNIK